MLFIIRREKYSYDKKSTKYNWLLLQAISTLIFLDLISRLRPYPVAQIIISDFICLWFRHVSWALVFLQENDSETVMCSSY